MIDGFVDKSVGVVAAAVAAGWVLAAVAMAVAEAMAMVVAVTVLTAGRVLSVAAGRRTMWNSRVFVSIEFAVAWRPACFLFSSVGRVKRA